MERTSAAEAGRSRLRERAHIASRMHDSLGHGLSLIAVRAAALEMASRHEPDQEAAASELHAATHEANLRLREVIGVLREEPDDGPWDVSDESVSTLVGHAAEAGLSVLLLRQGPGPEPDSWTGRTVHGVVREALTNAAEYAPGSRVSVHVVREEVPVRVPPTALAPLPLWAVGLMDSKRPASPLVMSFHVCLDSPKPNAGRFARSRGARKSPLRAHRQHR